MDHVVIVGEIIKENDSLIFQLHFFVPPETISQRKYNLSPISTENFAVSRLPRESNIKVWKLSWARLKEPVVII